MTTKKPHQTPAAGPESNRQASPWRSPAYAVGGDDDDAVPSFMSALRRFRARHGLDPRQQHPLIADDDLRNLRANDCERPVPDFDDVADDSAAP